MSQLSPCDCGKSTLCDCSPLRRKAEILRRQRMSDQISESEFWERLFRLREELWRAVFRSQAL